MSDLRTNPEIEDVLSSIRRLVSEEGRHRPASSAAPAPTRAVTPDGSGSKLVLTDALRVSGSENEALSEAEGGAEGAAASDAGLASPAADEELRPDARRQSLEATIAELEVAVARIGDDFEPDGGETAMPDKAGARDATIEDGFGSDKADAAAEAVDEAAQRSAEASESDGADAVDEESARPAETSQDRYDDEPWAVRTGDEADALTDAPAGDPDRESPDEDAADEARASDDEPGEAPEEGAMRRLHLGAADAVSGFEMAEPDSGIEPAAEATPASAGWSGSDEEDAELEALRALVADLIRQELQGPLGERATRNMRMLVRREIQRALDGREID